MAYVIIEKDKNQDQEQDKIQNQTQVSSIKTWGPSLWKILHSITESLGNQTNNFVATDEKNEILFLLDLVDTIMPCALCQKHYR